MSSILLLGCGQLGLNVAQALNTQGWSVCAVRRHPPAKGFEYIDWIAQDFSSTQVIDQVSCAKYVLYTPSPDQRDEASYRYLYHQVLLPLLFAAEKNEQLALWLQISSTSVYGQDAGEWVDEHTVAEPSSNTAKWIAQAEQSLKSYLPGKSACVRFSGIYGRGRDYLLKKVSQGTALRPNHFSNRIHQDDCVGLIVHLLLAHASGQTLSSVYVGTDQRPTSEWEIGCWIAQQMGLQQPARESDEQMTGKRCRSQRLASIGYALKYPSFIEGYFEEIQRFCSDTNLLAP